MHLFRNHKAIITVVVIGIGVLLRGWTATLGYNYDVESFQIVGNLAAEGRNVYANTSRYNYGPVWLMVLGALKWVQLYFGSNDIGAYHLCIAAVLTAADLAIALLLARYFGRTVGAVYFLCPVSVLITGFHSQFDNVAVLIALVSWLLIKDAPDRAQYSSLLVSAALMGVSLTTKHIMVFFPLWILLWAEFGSLGKRITYCGIAYLIFLTSFVPFAFAPEALAGIRQNVFLYNSAPRGSLLEHMVQAFMPMALVQRGLGWVPIFSGLKGVWLIVMAATGRLVMRHSPTWAPLYYLLALVVWTPSMAVQYLAIPMAACAVLWRRVSSWLYVAVGTLIIIQVPVNIGSLEPLRGLHGQLRAIGFAYYHAQVWLLVMLVWCYVHHVRRGTASQRAL